MFLKETKNERNELKEYNHHSSFRSSSSFLIIVIFAYYLLLYLEFKSIFLLPLEQNKKTRRNYLFFFCIYCFALSINKK